MSIDSTFRQKHTKAPSACIVHKTTLPAGNGIYGKSRVVFLGVEINIEAKKLH